MLARRVLYFVSFICLAGIAALGVARIGRPSEAATLLCVVVAASLAGSPGLIHRRAWPVALFLLPVGAFLVMRAQMPPPPDVRGAGDLSRFYLDQLRLGARAYGTQTFPLQFGDPSLGLLLSFVIYLATGLAAFAALSLRRPLPAIAVTLAVLGFAFTVDRVGAVVWLPLAFFLFAGSALMLSRSLGHGRWSAGDAVSGITVAGAGALLALALIGVTPAAAERPLTDWRTWGRPGLGARIGFDWMADYPHLLDPRTNAQVMLVESPIASYWRANALDQFDGMSWTASPTIGPPLVPEFRMEGSAYEYAVPADEPALRGRTIEETFDIHGLYTQYLLVGGVSTALFVDAPATINVNPALALRSSRPLGPSLHYRVTAVVSRPRATDLVGRGRRYSMGMVRFLDLPFPRLAEMTGREPEKQWKRWLGLFRLNQRIVGTASDPYEVTLRIEEYLRANYRYSLNAPYTEYEVGGSSVPYPRLSPYATFLFDTRAGCCQHFAGAMAVLLRFNGIPARVAVGFRTGKRVSHETYAVGTNDAHSWVEAYFPNVGWVPFDPTPGNTLPGPGPSSASAGLVDPFTASGSSSPTPGAAPVGPTRPATRTVTRYAEPGADAAAGGLAWFAWILVPAVALLLWPGGRVVVRRRRLRRGSAEARLGAGVRLVYADLRAYGVAAPRSWTLPETAGFLAEYLGLDASALAGRIDAVLFGARAIGPNDLGDLAALRRDVRRGLRARAGWVRALAEAFGFQVRTR